MLNPFASRCLQDLSCGTFELGRYCKTRVSVLLAVMGLVWGWSKSPSVLMCCASADHGGWAKSNRAGTNKSRLVPSGLPLLLFNPWYLDLQYFKWQKETSGVRLYCPDTGMVRLCDDSRIGAIPWSVWSVSICDFLSVARDGWMNDWIKRAMKNHPVHAMVLEKSSSPSSTELDFLPHGTRLLTRITCHLNVPQSPAYSLPDIDF